MHFGALNTLTLLALSSVVAAEEISNSTVPEACKAICNPVVELTNTCDINPMSASGDSKWDTSMRKRVDIEIDTENDMGNDMDMEEVMEADCICNNTSFDVSAVMGLCASCMGQESESANKTAVEGMGFLSNFLLARDIDRIMSQCSFPTTSYAPAATSVLSGIQVQATRPAVTVMPSNDTMGAAGRVEVATSVWAVGMLVASMGLGAGLVVGLL